MDEKEKKSEFSLEDILKEFGLVTETTQHSQEEENVRIWDGNPTPAEPSAVPQDTVRLDEITQAVKKMEAASEETVHFTPVGQEGEPEEESPGIIQPEQKVEPYSENWEPEYELPMGEYVPPQPIVFRPKSRLRELKKKLVEGPERRYYQLSEQGFGKLQAAIFLSLLVTLLAVGSTVMYSLGLVRENRIRLMVFGQFLFLLLSALLGSYQLMEGFSDILHRRFSLNSLLLFSLAACCVDCVLCLGQVRVPCCAAFSINTTMSLWSAYQKRSTEMAQMDTMRKATRLDSVVSRGDFYEGRPGYLRGEGQVEDFMDHYRKPSAMEKTLSVYALVCLFVCLGIGVASGVLMDFHTGVQTFCAGLLVAVPASAHVTLSRPMSLLERRLHKHGSVICGWRGVRDLSRSAVFPLTDTDIFPAGTAKMNGVKFCGSRDPDEVVSYATALITADGGSLAPLFSQLLESRSGYHYDAAVLQSYSGGIGGDVNGEAVLMGTLAFMQSMGVDMPEGIKVNQAVYVAIDGQLAGVFAVTYAKVKSAAVGLTTLCAYRGLTPVMTTGDFMLTESFLRGKFGINARRITFPDRATRAELAAKEPEEGAPALALTTNESLAGMAYAVTGSRALRSAAIVGTVVHMLGGILGMLSVLALVIVGAEHLLTPGNILLYELIWMIPGLLITEWTRSV